MDTCQQLVRDWTGGQHPGDVANVFEIPLKILKVISSDDSSSLEVQEKAMRDGLGDRMSAKRTKLVLPDKISSEEEGTTGPTTIVEGNSNLFMRIAELEHEKADMAQQLECQLAFIKELQQQMAEMEAANMAAKQPVHHQQEQQQQLIIQQRQQQQEQRKQRRQQQQRQQQSEDDGMCPEVIIEEEEGYPFNFVVRKKKAANRNKVSAITV
ncbi:putative uncharacterized protein DDB_G0274435 [Hermetia illucens]|uniref:putative uncharacterized protein DDB_G0274435 n=1 Tax=Hermetia illucens TaxID=343691 RepID=UPI0018CC2A1A|nr:putative uncharacterized protein DDB_G0274435 [Hermetia illucens]